MLFHDTAFSISRNQPGAVKVKKDSKVYLKPLFISNSKISFNILIIPCNTPYNAFCDPV